MKKKFMKFLIAASVITVFASFASLAASITIDSIDEVNTTTGDVKVSFTATDMAAADQVTALVFTPTAQNSGPVDTNIVYIDQNSNGTFSGKLNFKMKAGVKQEQTVHFLWVVQALQLQQAKILNIQTM
ncbi:MAG: hypothetical protein IKL42_04495 [Clostridia bacterium]|nr:hypothetical protein [Clostridia bacterium]